MQFRAAWDLGVPSGPARRARRGLRLLTSFMAMNQVHIIPLYLRHVPASQLFKCAVVSRSWLDASSDALADLLNCVRLVGPTDVNALSNLLNILSKLHTLDISSIPSDQADIILSNIHLLSFRTSLHTLRSPALGREWILEGLAECCTNLASLSISGMTVNRINLEILFKDEHQICSSCRCRSSLTGLSVHLRPRECFNAWISAEQMLMTPQSHYLRVFANSGNLSALFLQLY